MDKTVVGQTVVDRTAAEEAREQRAETTSECRGREGGFARAQTNTAALVGVECGVRGGGSWMAASAECSGPVDMVTSRHG